MRSLRSLRAVALIALLIVSAVCAAWLAFALPRSARFDFDQPLRTFGFSRFSGTEYLPDGRPFRWSRPTALLALPNPGIGTLRWRFVFAAGPRSTVPLTLTMGSYVLPPITVTSEPRVYTVLAPQRQQRTQVNVLLNALPTRDADADRALGVVVGPFAVTTTGRSSPPTLFVLALLAASLGAYVLIRQAGLKLPVTLALVVGAQLLYALAEALWLWRWSLSPRLLALLGIGAVAAVVVERWLLPLGNKETRKQGNKETRGQAGASWQKQSAINSWQPLILLITLVLITRLPLLGLSDPSGDINTAADRAVLLANEGLSQAYHRGNDYLALRQYVLLGLGNVAQSIGLSLNEPLSYAAAALLKTPQLLADLGVVIVIYLVARHWRSSRAALGLAALYALTPPIWMNAAWWGQVDSLLILGMLLALVWLGPLQTNQHTASGLNNAQRATRNAQRVAWSWFVWALVLGVKAQPVLLLPVLAAATLRLHRARGLLIGGCTALATLVLGALPLILAEQMAGLLTAYEGSVGRYPYSSVSAYNLWSLLHGVRQVRDDIPAAWGLTPLQWGLLLLAVVCVVVVGALLRRADAEARFTAGAVLALAFFALTTQMHQRYIVFTFPFLVLCVAYNPRLLLVYVLLAVSATITIFGTLPFLPGVHAAINASPLPTLAALVHLGVLGVLLTYLWQRAWGDNKLTRWQGDKVTRVKS